jgi:pimeloyl-ACP methyl ester carboxylesterase
VLGILTLFLAVGAPPEQAEACPGISPAQFCKWFDAAREDNLRIPAKVSRKVRRVRFVFVGGFEGERMLGYFAQNAKELRARSVPKQSIHFISPSSHKSVTENRETVRARFQEIAHLGPEKLVVIGHSRGACDALAFALANPEFVADHVEAMFLVQGPFGGSGLADYVVGEGPAMDGKMPWRHRLIGYALGTLEAYQLHRGKHGGLTSLTRSASQEFWEEALEEHEAAIPVVGPKTYYVTTKTKPTQLKLFLQATASYLGAYFGPNDGIVALEDQALPELGTVLAVLDAGHRDLTNRFLSSRQKKRLQNALVDAIIMAVGQTKDEGSNAKDEG